MSSTRRMLEERRRAREEAYRRALELARSGEWRRLAEEAGIVVLSEPVAVRASYDTRSGRAWPVVVVYLPGYVVTIEVDGRPAARISPLECRGCW